jgi:hypothetical protein
MVLFASWFNFMPHPQTPSPNGALEKDAGMLFAEGDLIYIIHPLCPPPLLKEGEEREKANHCTLSRGAIPL